MQALHLDSTGEDMEGQKAHQGGRSYSEVLGWRRHRANAACVNSESHGAQSTPKGLSYLCLFKPKEKKIKHTQARE